MDRREALGFLQEDLHVLETDPCVDPAHRQALRHTLVHLAPTEFLKNVEGGVLRATLPLHELQTLIDLLLITVDRDARHAQTNTDTSTVGGKYAASVCRSSYG